MRGVLSAKAASSPFHVGGFPPSREWRMDKQGRIPACTGDCNTLGTVPFSPRLLHLRCTLQQKDWIPAFAGMTVARE